MVVKLRPIDEIIVVVNQVNVIRIGDGVDHSPEGLIKERLV